MNKKQKEVQQQFLDNEKAVLKKIEQNYKDAFNEINSKIELLMARKDADMQHVIYQVQYQKSLADQVAAILEQFRSNEFETISEYLANAYEDGFIGTMYDLQGQGIPLVSPISQEQVVAAIQHETKLSDDLYTALGKDTKDLSKKIAGEISRGISSGAMYSEIARNVEAWGRIPKNNAMRIARTEAHRIQTKASMNACNKAKENGADVVKQWDAALDKRTRDSHAKIDGEIRELDKKFSNGLMYPGDPSGAAAEVINCRCALLQRARWNLGSDYTKWDEDAPIEIADDGTSQLAYIPAKTYKNFKEQYKKASERVRRNVQKIILEEALENDGKSSKIYVDNRITSYLEFPETLGDTTHKEKYDDFVEHGANVKPLSRGNLKGISYKDGGGYKVNGSQDGQYLQYHPADKSHHKGEYYKLSSGTTGTRRYNMNGELIE